MSSTGILPHLAFHGHPYIVEILRSAPSEFEVEEGVTKVVDLEGETPNRGRIDKERF